MSAARTYLEIFFSGPNWTVCSGFCMEGTGKANCFNADKYRKYKFAVKNGAATTLKVLA